MIKHADCDDANRDIYENPICTCKDLDFHNYLFFMLMDATVK